MYLLRHIYLFSSIEATNKLAFQLRLIVSCRPTIKITLVVGLLIHGSSWTMLKCSTQFSFANNKNMLCFVAPADKRYTCTWSWIYPI